MSTALITGSSGQDGSYLIERLAAEGWRVHATSRRARRAAPNSSPAVEWHSLEVEDSDALTAIVREAEPDVIFNLAAMSSVAESWKDPLRAGLVNGMAVVVLLEACLREQERTGRSIRVVQASSAEVFGQALSSPQTELSELRPINPYGAAKAFAQSSIQMYRDRGLFASSCVLFNHESPRRPPQFVTRKITMAVARIASGLDNEIALGNLDARRDWGWAPDYVDAMIRAAVHERAGDFVIATGSAHSVGDFVREAFSAAGISQFEKYVRIDPQFIRPRDAVELVGDATKARSELNWRTTRSFEQIVQAMTHNDIELLQTSGPPKEIVEG